MNRMIFTTRKTKMTEPLETTRRHYQRFGYAALLAIVALGFAFPGSAAFAADKPPSNSDPPSPFTTTARVSATIEFDLPALASAIERYIPRRLVTIDEEISCVQTPCKHGHTLSDAYISRLLGGYIKRDCRTCWAIRQKQAPKQNSIA
jgi:hypothetical protein